jgi:PadR family transcriptional regulator, regulatory protein AphA
MTGRHLTPFEHILLGLICTEPSSGYDLKRIFAATPMGVYQPSSGTLYTALRRLEQKGLVRAQAPSGQGEQSARHRRVYEPTQAGQTAHLNWLRTPVDPATVAPDLGLHLMRFVMMEHLLPPDEVLTFLRNLADTIAAFTARLERYGAAADFPQRHPRLALDHGVAIARASLRWAEHTIAALSADPPCDLGHRESAGHDLRAAGS